MKCLAASYEKLKKKKEKKSLSGPWPVKQNCPVRCRKYWQVMTLKGANFQTGQSFSLPLCWPSFMSCRHYDTVLHDQPRIDYSEFTQI